MNLLKKIFTKSYLKKFVFSLNWTIICILLAVLLLCLLIFLIIKRKKNKAAKEPEQSKKKDESLPPSGLLQIWKTFLKNIPARFRRSILMYQPYIVMGEAGTGKTRLIDNYTDWKNQANQFYPSHTQDELLQVYLGTRIIVQEISSSLLHDTKAATRIAFKNLWKVFKRRKDLTVVITIKGDDLIHGDPDFLREQAQMMRGKINILSEILRRPVKVGIVLTFMNQVKGFLEFSAFMYTNNLPFELTKEQLSDTDNLENAMSCYEQYFSNALVSEKPEDYLRILSFCQTAPIVFSSLSGFIKVLTAQDPLSVSPELANVFFTSDTVTEDTLLSNPFNPRVPMKKIRSYNPMRKHKIAALLIAVIGVVYMLFSYNYKLNSFSMIMEKLDKINFSIINDNGKSKEVMYPGIILGNQSVSRVARPAKRIDLGSQNTMSDKTTQIGKDQTLWRSGKREKDFSFIEEKQNYKRYVKVAKSLDKLDKQSRNLLDSMLLPDFLPDAEKQIHAKIVSVKNNLRKKILYSILKPRLVPLDVQQNAIRRNLLILSVIYGSKSNKLGKLINDNIGLWVSSCNISRNIIKTYLSLSDKSWNKVISVNKFINSKSSLNTGKYISWFIFLQSLDKIIHDSFVSPATLAELKKEAVEITGEINESLKEDWFDKLRFILGRETVLGKAILPFQTDKSFFQNDYAAFKKFLGFFTTLDMTSYDVADMPFAKLLEDLRVMMKLKNPATKYFSFTINRQRFYFNSDQLYNLIRASSMTMLLRNYVAYYSRFPGVSFFHQNREYKDLVVDISTDDNFYFSKKAVIDGRYTRKIYDLEVKPVLASLPDLLKKLPLNETEKVHFSNFMFREVDAYITGYISSYENYYKNFRISADSVGELRYILTQMTLPMNQFQEFLVILNNNLSLDCADNPYFNLIKSRLRPLKFISLVMQAQKDQFPELEKYKAILRQLLGDLVATGPVAVDDSEGSAGILKSKLSPVARIALDIFLNGSESYLKMVEKWGASIGIPEQWLYPFTEPIYQAYLLGQKKIEKTVKKEWEDLKTDYVNPVIDKFPFNPEATAFVTPEDLKNLACLTGEFWKRFSGGIAPLCRKTLDGKWHEKTFAMSSLELPKNMLKEISYISQLSGIFFDDKAKPVPLVFEIEPHPLPLIQNKMILVVLSYLRTGKKTVFGFNQQPSWQKFSIEWWKPNTSSVGVEFMQRGKSGKKMFADIAVQNSFWSFYRLLKKAETPEPGIWMWDIQSPGDIKWKRAILFSIRKNPWSVFKKELLAGKQ